MIDPSTLSTVCSKQAFGDQCQNTCNCNGTEGCDDVFGTCADGCLSGWEGGLKSTLHCNALSNSSKYILTNECFVIDLSKIEVEI